MVTTSINVDAIDLLESMPDGLLLISGDGLVVYASSVAEQLLGYELGSLTGLAISELIPAHICAQHPSWRAAYGEDRADRPIRVVRQLQALRGDNSQLPVEVSVAPWEISGEQMVIASLRAMNTRLNDGQDGADQDGDGQARATAADPTPQLDLDTERFRLVADISEALARIGSDPEEVLESSARALARSVGDACVVSLIDAAGGLLVPKAIAHRDPLGTRVLREVLLGTPFRVGTGYSGSVAVSATPIVATDVPVEQLRESINPDYLPYIEQFPSPCFLIVPLVANGRILGTISLSGQHEYSSQEQGLVEGIAGRVALAVDRARLHRQVRVVAGQLDSMFQSTSVGMALADLNGSLVHTNPAFAQLVGRNVTELSGMNLLDLSDSDEHRATDEMALQALQSGEVTSEVTQRRYRRPDGSEIWIRMLLNARTEDGRLVGLSAQIEDVTEAHVATAKLVDTNREISDAYRQLQAVTNGLPVLVGYWDRELRSRFANDAYREFFGLTEEQVGGGHVDRILGPDRYEQNRGHIELALQGTGQKFDRSWVDDSGQERDFEVSYLPHEVDGQVVGIFVLAAEVTQRVADAQELAANHEQLRAFAENSSDVVWAIDEAGSLTWASPSIEDFLGYTAADVVGSNPIDWVHPDDLAEAEACRAKALGGVQNITWELRIARADGEYRWMSAQVRPQRGGADRPTGVVYGVRDVHDEVIARQALVKNERLFRLAMDGAPQGMAIVGLHLKFLQVNGALARILNRDSDWLLDHTVTDLLYSEDFESDLTARDELLAGSSETVQREQRFVTGDGRIVWVLHAMSLLRDEFGMPLFYVSHMHDITSSRVTRSRLEYRARHDPLTGLLNRGAAIDAIGDRFGQGNSDGSEAKLVGLLFCDLDAFKEINDSRGHRVGDAVLQVIAERIQRSIRPGDLVARLGGDEFVVILGEVEALDEAEAVAERISSAAAVPIRTDGHQEQVGISIGICLAPSTHDPNAVLEAADGALYRAKEGGGNCATTIDLRSPSGSADRNRPASAEPGRDWPPRRNSRRVRGRRTGRSWRSAG